MRVLFLEEEELITLLRIGDAQVVNMILYFTFLYSKRCISNSIEESINFGINHWNYRWQQISIEQLRWYCHRESENRRLNSKALLYREEKLKRGAFRKFGPFSVCKQNNREKYPYIEKKTLVLAALSPVGK